MAEGIGAQLLFGASGYDLGRLSAQVEAIATAGFEGVWAGEINNLDAVSLLALAGAHEPRVRLGAFVSAFTRAPATLAMTVSTLGRAFPGRSQLGLGAGSKLLVQDWSGTSFERPYHRVRDVLRFLRMALARERITDDFATFRAAGFRLAEVPADPPRILIAGVNPDMVRLGLEEADGVVLNWCSLEDALSMPEVAARPDRTSAVVYVCPSTDPTVVRELAVPMVVAYMSVPGYARFQRRLGRAPMLNEMWERVEAGDSASAASAVPQDVVDELFVWGSPAACRARIREYATRGVQPIVTLLTPDQDALTSAARDLAGGGAAW